MKKHSLTDYLILYLAKTLGFVFRAIPVSGALFIGRFFGRLAMFLNKKRTKIAYANLKAAFSSRFHPKQLRKILRGTYANIGQGLVEVFLLPKLGKEYVARHLEFEDFHYAKDILKQGKGLIFLTAHFGNWEMSNVALPLEGFTYKAIAREQKPYLLNKLLNAYRESKGCKILLKGPAVKEAIRTLHSGGIVGMLVDQDAGKTGMFIDLFNRPASWNTGVMEIAMRTGAAIVPGFSIRKKGSGITFKLFKPIVFSGTKADKESEIRRGFKEYVSHLEDVVSKYPEQWLWQHRRWKSSPLRRVLILNDGRTGHLRQSEAVANKLRDLWVEKGHKEEEFSVDIVDIYFRNDFLKILVAFLVKIPFTFSPGSMW
ncbi:MAG: lysophospholipid acyltransferase family protein, partial [Candidatus Omnitrophota bacterium]